MTKKRATRPARRFVEIGSFAALLLVGVVVVGFVIKIVLCLRLESALAAATDSALGERPDVAAIVSARAAFVTQAHRSGVEHHAVRVVIDRRDAGDDGAVHVVLFNLRTKTCHAEVARSLERLLREDELHALRHAGITERTAPDGRRR